ncbi:MAG TPA: flagellar hook capping FlgD N-terminal domain-containing protein [Jatrophihabitans sp.]|jgi:flagellar basal-body rod modification protein FlgD|nr:flagellar hook capping FlgD N-terminal domain-containing protein [Jatrophihabitans sp.]
MTTPVTSATATGTVPTATPTSSDRSTLDPQAFLQLLVAQLQYQDPSNPVDTSAFMQQTATLSQVQTMNSMSTTLTSLLSAQQAQAATELIGKTVTYADTTGVQKSGVVDSAALLSTGATLSVDGVDVPLTSVMGVSATAPSTKT